MWPFIKPISLIRYLCVWRVNRALVRLPAYLPLELSQVLGHIIADHLPSRHGRLWRKSLAGKAEMNPGWPVESVLFAYPGKRLYGPGEPILWELKLLGSQADHNFFLEAVLPAMESASQTRDSRWYQSHSLWGRFDIEAVYVAKGSTWDPLVYQGRLDTNYWPQPNQWAEDLAFLPEPQDDRNLRFCNWLSPVDLRPLPTPFGSLDTPSESKTNNQNAIPVPGLQLMLDGLLARIAQITPGKYATPGEVWTMLEPDDQAALQAAFMEIDRVELRDSKRKKLAKTMPDGWLGEQAFGLMPASLIPYLELASILHVGRQTHLGYGTFTLS